MTNPVEVEKQFLELQHRLAGNLTYRHQWLLIGDFLRLIKGQYVTYDTHCEQLAEHLPVFNHPLSVAGTDPGKLQEVLEVLREMLAAIPSINELPQAVKAKDSLVCATVFLFICIHEFKSANHVLFKEILAPESLPEISNPEEYLQFAIGITGERNLKTAADQLQTIKGWFHNVQQKKKNRILIPVIEESDDGESLGRLRELTAKVLSNREQEDYFRNSYSVVGAESEDVGIRKEVPAATRKLITDTHAWLSEQFYEIQFEFAIPIGVHEGRSSELGCCITAYSAILDEEKSRERYRPKESIAVTGSITSDCSIGKVDPNGLYAKVQAAFFSWIEYLVVPEQQKTLFLDQLAILQERYPDCKLTLIGLEDPKAFFYDRRISEHRVDSRTKHLAKKVWQQKFSLAGIATIIILLVVIGRLWYGPFDQNPVTGTFEGRMLNLYNARGALVNSFELGIENNFYQFDNGTDGNKPQVQLHDLDEDGINEVFWYESSQLEKTEYNQLKSWSITGDSLIWKMPLYFDIRFPRKNSIVNTEYMLDEFHIQKNEDGIPKIIGSSRQDSFFPAVIFSADARTGELQQQYVHAGHFNDIVVEDLDEDNLYEVIAIGGNNAFWNAAIAVLRLDNIQGHGPVQGDYVVKDFDPADELCYILVPKTVVGKYYDPIKKMNFGINVRVREGENLLYLRIRDAGPVDFPGAAPAYILLYMNSEFRIEGVGTADAYDILAKRLHREGKIPFEPDYEYFEAFKDSLVYLRQ